ncbi:MAG TPA: cbb3-type cytochrome c oxidase subunit I, partial [Roseiflexaceae bacterium]|nr:cbb3-type cytochrome c oxidase subunit I [Roseiflexaceae bacterium]
IGFIAMFIIGGISGITLASPPVDLQQTDSYYVVAHLHYVLFGGSILGIFAGLFYWFPKITGRMLDERLGKIQFWSMLISFNMTFFPMHITGTDGMPRRIYTYEAGMGWDFWNLFATVGSFLMAGSVLLFVYNALVSLRTGKIASNDPWDGATLEWAVPSPPPVYNFEKIPTVHSRRPLWDTKYPDLDMAHEPGKPALKRSEAMALERERMGEIAQPPIHLPSPTWNPLIIAVGLTLLFFGILYSAWLFLALPLVIGGLLLVAVAIVGWVRDSHKDSPYIAH